MNGIVPELALPRSSPYGKTHEWNSARASLTKELPIREDTVNEMVPELALPRSSPYGRHMNGIVPELALPRSSPYGKTHEWNSARASLTKELPIREDT